VQTVFDANQSVHGSTALCWASAAFSLSWSFYSQQNSLDGGSAGRKAATYTQNNTDIYILSGIRTHDPSVWAGEDSSCLRPRGHSMLILHLKPWSS
jgi:hypothetical protein